MKLIVKDGGLVNADADNTVVLLGGKICPVQSVGQTEIECEIPSQAENHNVNLDIVAQAWGPQTVQVQTIDIKFIFILRKSFINNRFLGLPI